MGAFCQFNSFFSSYRNRKDKEKPLPKFPVRDEMKRALLSQTSEFIRVDCNTKETRVCWWVGEEGDITEVRILTKILRLQTKT